MYHRSKKIAKSRWPWYSCFILYIWIFSLTIKIIYDHKIQAIQIWTKQSIFSSLIPSPPQVPCGRGVPFRVYSSHTYNIFVFFAYLNFLMCLNEHILLTLKRKKIKALKNEMEILFQSSLSVSLEFGVGGSKSETLLVGRKASYLLAYCNRHTPLNSLSV